MAQHVLDKLLLLISGRTIVHSCRAAVAALGVAIKNTAAGVHGC